MYSIRVQFPNVPFSTLLRSLTNNYKDEEGSATRDPIYITDDDNLSDEFLPPARNDRYVNIDGNSRLDVEEPLPPSTQQARIARGVNDDDDSGRDDENLRSQFNNTTVYGDEDPNLDSESQASSGEHSNLDADRDFSVPLFDAVDHFF
jgi:hypothetical protein